MGEKGEINDQSDTVRATRIQRREHDLIRQAQEGNKEAFAQLIGARSRKILYRCFLYSRSTSKAEDLAQESTINAYRGIAGLEDPARFDTWLARIIKNTCLKGKGAMEKNTVYLDPEDYEYASSKEKRLEFLPMEYVENADKRTRLMQAINQLPSSYQEVLVLFYYEGFSYAEIADTLKVTESKVTNDLARGRKLLKEHLENQTGDKFSVTALAAGAMPALSQAFELDAIQHITPAMQNHLTDFAAAIPVALIGVEVTSAAAGTATHAITAKVVAIAAGFVLTAGVVGGAIVANLPEGEPSSIENSVTEEPGSATKPTTDSPSESVSEPAPGEHTITTLADLIGAEREAQLIAFRQSGASVQELQDFLTDIGAEQVASVGDGQAIFEALHVTKQDKQLQVLTKWELGSETLQLSYSFGDVRDTPRPLELKRMFGE